VAMHACRVYRNRFSAVAGIALTIWAGRLVRPSSELWIGGLGLARSRPREFIHMTTTDTGGAEPCKGKVVLASPSARLVHGDLPWRWRPERGRIGGGTS
jgi:hypothetical protein